MHIAPGASPKSNWGRWQEWWIVLALFGATGGFVGWFLDPPARYFASAPLFRLRSDFFLPHLQRLGGLLEYAASFLAQLDCLAWLGGFVFAGLVLLVSLATRSLLRRSGAHLAGVWTCPGLGLLLLYGQTPTPATGVAGGILLALTFLLVAPRARTYFPSMTLCLLYVAGPLPCLLFIVSGGLHEWHHRRSPRAALTCGVWILAWLAGVAVAGNSWVPLPPKQWPDSVSIATLVGLYASYPMLFILGIWMSRRQRSETIQEKAATKTSSGSAELTSVPPTRGWPGIALVLMVLAATTLGLRRETGRRHLNRLQAAAEGEDWRGVLNAATHLTYLPPAARLQLVRALYHLGRLNDDLFTFPQQSGVDLLASLSDGLAVCLPLSDTLFELGQINLAEHYAHEAMEVRGERPELLWRLARINLVKERPQAARVYLNLLSQTPFFRGRAARWLGSLDRDPTLRPRVFEKKR